MIRTKEKVTYDQRDQKKSIVAIEVVSWHRQKKRNNYIAFIEDYAQVPLNSENEANLFSYRKINSKTLEFSNQEIQDLFQQIGQEISKDDNYNEKNDLLIDRALLKISKSKQTYGTENWEIIDSDT